jgi:glycogen debranching enzyme
VLPEVSVLRRRDTASVAAAERPSNEHYRRYLTLVRRGTELGWPQERLARSGSFRVLDPGFSAILARAAFDLGALAEQLGESAVAEECAGAAEELSAALRTRTDSDGLIRPVDLLSGAPLQVTSAGSALVLLVPELGPDAARAARALVREGPLASPYGVRSLARDHPELAPLNYWRGPVWANITWLCALGLELAGDLEGAEELRGRMLLAVEGGGMREYFEPATGHGLGAQDFAWTAALTLRELGAGGQAEQAA